MSVAYKKKDFSTLYKEFQNAPDNMVAEILNSELVLSPRPSPKHSHASTNLIGEIVSPFGKGKGGPGGWTILFEPEIHIEETIFVPDIAGWKKENLQNSIDKSYIEVVPDWVCEILSPSTAKYDRVIKLHLYLDLGIPFYWIIDPINQTLEILKSEKTNWSIIKVAKERDVGNFPPFQEIEIDLGSLWGL